jgi:exodeoxyribonuclease VII large subunit
MRDKPARKVGRLEWAPDSGEVRIRFRYDPALVEAVRALPRRRFSREDRAWYVPRESVLVAMESLAPLGFEVTPEVAREAQREQRRRARAVEIKSQILEEEGAQADHPQARTYTPAELNTRVRVLLRRAFSSSVWVIGEMSGWRQAPGGRASFFELVEKDPRSAVHRARIRAVVFPEEHRRILQKIERMRESLDLEDGLQVRLLGRVDLYERSGSYQLRVEDIDPYHTLSHLVQRRELILEQLEDMGIAQNNPSLEVPLVPLRVGLITSQGSDAYQDFISELLLSGLGFQVQVYDARMQGRDLEPTVLAALEHFAHSGGVDVVAIIRGGGSRTELSHFDSLPLAMALCQHPLPIICGIGHQADRCIVDDVVRSLKTPTAAAAWLVQRVRQVVAELDSAALRIEPAARRALDAARLELRHQAQRRCRDQGRQLDDLAARLSPHRLLRRLDQRSDELADLQHRIARGSARLLERRAREIAQLEARRQALDPQRVLGRGFAMVHHPGGALVRSAADVDQGQALEVRLARGRLRVLHEESLDE